MVVKRGWIVDDPSDHVAGVIVNQFQSIGF